MVVSSSFFPDFLLCAFPPGNELYIVCTVYFVLCVLLFSKNMVAFSWDIPLELLFSPETFSFLLRGGVSSSNIKY